MVRVSRILGNGILPMPAFHSNSFKGRTCHLFALMEQFPNQTMAGACSAFADAGSPGAGIVAPNSFAVRKLGVDPGDSRERGEDLRPAGPALFVLQEAVRFHAGRNV